MNPFKHIAGLLALGGAAAAAAQGATLTPPAGRISDAAIQADHRTYEAVQERLRALNAAGRPLRDATLAQAQCWLDVSFHEYTRNDRSDFPQAALAESERLAVAMASGAPTPPLATPLIAGADRLRPDLWARATALREHAGWRCAQHKVACAEVELVHAGHEHRQGQWRHAQPYVQIAEDLMADAVVLAESCAPAPAVVARAEPAPVAPPAPSAVVPAPVREVQLLAQVLFDFDGADARHVPAFSMVQLQTLVARVREQGLQIVAVHLDGHADRLNRSGQDDYNLRLSERRVATVRGLLAELGVEASRVQTRARGDTQPVTHCTVETAGSPAALRGCLQPDRRVTVEIVTRQP